MPFQASQFLTQSLNNSGPNKDQTCQMGELFPRSNTKSTTGILLHFFPVFLFLDPILYDFFVKTFSTQKKISPELVVDLAKGGGAGFGDMAETLFWAQQLGLSRPMASCPGIAGLAGCGGGVGGGSNDAVQATTQGLCLSLGDSVYFGGGSAGQRRKKSTTKIRVRRLN